MDMTGTSWETGYLECSKISILLFQVDSLYDTSCTLKSLESFKIINACTWTIK